MTDPQNAMPPAAGTETEGNSITPVSPQITAKRRKSSLKTLLPIAAATTLTGGLAIGGWVAWRAHNLAENDASQSAGNVASKTSIGKNRSDVGNQQDAPRRLGADGEVSSPDGNPAPGQAGSQPRVPAILQANPRNDGAQAIPVRDANGGNGQPQAPIEPPRSRYDAPMRFGSAPEAAPAQRFTDTPQPANRSSTLPAGTTTRAAAGTRPDYSVPPTTGLQGLPSTPAAAPEKGALNLKTIKTEKAYASLLGNRDFLLAKGASIDCDLETAIRSNLPGMARCVTLKDAWSDNGRVVLIERGSTLTGEYRADVQQGQAEIQVIWNRVRTTQGVVVDLASPATDALGRAGIDGEVDNHWRERMGAAFLLSFVKDAISYATATHGTNTAATGVVYGNTASTGESMSNTILKQTINIPPTITRNQGTRVKVFVARDLDFSKVYDLQLNPGAGNER